MNEDFPFFFPSRLPWRAAPGQVSFLRDLHRIPVYLRSSPVQASRMNITHSTPAQLDRLRRAFRLLNKFMVFMWKIGLGPLINVWPAGFGRIMVIRHVGRKSGKERLAPVNYAVVEGEIYCTAGFGPGSDWYRNIMAAPAHRGPASRNASGRCDLFHRRGRPRLGAAGAAPPRPGAR